MKRVLCILENGFEEIETITPVDLLRRAGVEVIMASTSPGRVTGRSQITITPDAILDDVIHQSFDALFLPGGPAVMQLRKNPHIVPLIRNFHNEAKPIAAICAAPLLLHDAGLLDGRNLTAHFTTELPNNTSERVVLDGNILTSRGAGTALDFGLALVTLLCGKESAHEISKAIMA